MSFDRSAGDAVIIFQQPRVRTMAGQSQRSDLIEFVKRLLARNPDAAQSIVKRLRDKAGLETANLAGAPPSPREVMTFGRLPIDAGKADPLRSDARRGTKERG